MLEFAYYSFSGLLIIFLLYVLIISLYSLIRGAPYAALGSDRLKTVIELLDIKKGEKIADLGSGDGRIVIAAAKKGATSVGYEINYLLVLLSRKNIKKSGLKNASIRQKDFWSENYSSYDSITIYTLPHILGALGRKLRKELKPGSKVVSNHYKFPGWKITKSEGDVHLYII